ncbi:MOLPALP family lipoprotein [Williamsoniiplasma lucivorax]|uniref:MOLPALP family lipoprotein n=1 Tax=Williamsoniiplasma lucivorax TaxID=209274 RepID=A0A2S5RDK5_9MOLU|nr:MOLPALP family lipoprotein [Williamsoniiplasma lucivorax]PPE05205.1 MOLPALP family lipoprotein [Williamsoniiplasma lucivorax]
MIKKLLPIFGTLSIVAASTSIVGFSFSNKVKSSIEAKIRNYINISSLIARGAIIGQKKDAPDGNGQGVALTYGSRYMNDQKMGNLINGELGNAKDMKVSQLVSSMFSVDNVFSNPYTVANWGSFNNGVTTGGLDLEMKNNKIDKNKGLTGESQFAKTFGLISGVFSMLFATDFSAETIAPLLEQLLPTSLVANTVKNMIATQDATLLEVLDPIINGKLTEKTLFAQIQSIINEDDLHTLEKPITEFTFKDVFDQRINDFWKGLAEILFSGTDLPGETPKSYKEWLKGITDAKTATKGFEGISIAFNDVLIDGVAKVLKYLRTLLIYMQEFQRDAELIGSQGIDHQHLFKHDETNGQTAIRIRGSKYINPNDVITNEVNKANDENKIIRWTKTGNKYSQVINLQQIFGLLQNLLSFDENDPNGYALQRVLFTTLFGNALDRDNKIQAETPIWDKIVDPLIRSVIPSVGVFDPVIKGILDKALYSIPMMIGSDFGFYDEKDQGMTIQTLLGILNPLLGFILAKIFPGEINKEKRDKITKVFREFKTEVDEDSKNPQKFNHIFSSLFKGNLIDELTPLIESFIGGTFKIPPGLNIKKLLTMKMGDLLSMFGLNIWDSANMLYGLKEKSLSDIIDTVANEFEVVRNRTMIQSQSYLLNLGTLDTIFNALNAKVVFTFKDRNQIQNVWLKTQIELIPKKEWDIVSALLIGLAWGEKHNAESIEKVIIKASSEISWNKDTTSLPSFLLGIENNKTTGIFTFRKNSLLDGVQQLYGHNIVENPIIEKGNKKTIASIVNNLTTLSTWILDDSLPKYVQERIAPYFNKDLWTTELIDYSGVASQTEPGVIKYYLKYTNPNTHKETKYEVGLLKGVFQVDGQWTTETPNWVINTIIRKD